LLWTIPELLYIFTALQETSSTTATRAKLFDPTPGKNLDPYDVFPESGGNEGARRFAFSSQSFHMSKFVAISDGSASQMVG
jgi:hypothetical protein